MANDYKFGDGRFEPTDGKWTNVTSPLEVAGISHRLGAYQAFELAVETAENTGAIYGLKLEPDFNNAFDENAIKVLGYVEVPKPFGGTKQKIWHIGYVPAEITKKMRKEYCDKGIRLETRMYHIYAQTDGYRSVDFVILASSDDVGGWS